MSTITLHVFRNYQDLLSQALTWEKSGEYSRTIDFLLKLTVENCDDHDVLQQSWSKVRWGVRE